jgi:hypothetical protein
MIFGGRLFTLRSQADRNETRNTNRDAGSIDKLESEGNIMKTLITAVAFAAALATPVLSFAQQSDAPLSRAQVRAELVQLKDAGYNPNINDPAYPSNIQAAETRVSTQTLAQAQPQSSDYGSVATGTSQSGRTNAAQPRAMSTYFGQ